MSGTMSLEHSEQVYIINSHYFRKYELKHMKIYALFGHN